MSYELAVPFILMAVAVPPALFVIWEQRTLDRDIKAERERRRAERTPGA